MIPLVIIKSYKKNLKHNQTNEKQIDTSFMSISETAEFYQQRSSFFFFISLNKFRSERVKNVGIKIRMSITFKQDHMDRSTDNIKIGIKRRNSYRKNEEVSA